MAHLFIVVVYDSFNRNNVKISKTYNFPDFSFFMSQDDAHYHNHQNAPNCQKCLFLQNQEMNINVDIMLHKEEGDIRISQHQVSNN